MELKRVVVTGLGAITPLGNDVPSTWAALLEGVSGAGPITLFDASEFKTQFACQVKDFDPLKYFNAKEARKLDRYTQFALAATQESIADSGLDLETVNKDRAGVIFSAGIGGISTFEQEVGNYAVAPEKVTSVQPVLYPENDCRHRRRTNIHDIRFPGTQLRYRIGMCIFYPRPHRRI